MPPSIVCTARTDLKRLEAHLGPAGGAARVAVLQISPDGGHSPSYQEFVKVLLDKERVGVAKWEEYTLFLVPPGAFTQVGRPLKTAPFPPRALLKT
eukprot:9492216-Pyramimonas_sp.AAC.1